MQTVEMIGWLGKIWDEDEGLAKKATAGPWRHDPRKHWRKPGTAWFEEAVFAGPAGKDAVCVAGTGESDDPQSIYDAAFIAQHDPEAMLARITAERALLARYVELVEWRDWLEPDASGGAHIAVEHMGEAVKIIASGYAARPGYDEGWRP